MMPKRKRKQIVAWLVCCLAMVALMVAVGGYTRLTQSGLSIVEWKPVAGIVPPLGDAAWREAFDSYKQSPEYLKINTGMTLEEFRNIFWVEYSHRLLGRITGLVFFLPLAVFALQRAITKALALRLAGIFLLGGLQGALGWYMVSSGLVNDPWVSPLRLAAHLGLAFILFALILWTLLDILYPRQGLFFAAPLPAHICHLSRTVIALLFLQVLLGALLAGLDGGLTYNTFPLMDGQWIPEGLWRRSPWYENFYDNIALVQFNHRIVGILTALTVVAYCLYALRQPLGRMRPGFVLLFLLVIAQFALGMATLLLHVPLLLALEHQLNALLLFGTCVALHHRLLSRPLRNQEKTGIKKQTAFKLK